MISFSSRPLSTKQVFVNDVTPHSLGITAVDTIDDKDVQIMSRII